MTFLPILNILTFVGPVSEKTESKDEYIKKILRNSFGPTDEKRPTLSSEPFSS